MTKPSKAVRVAIYTRKSVEDSEDKQFNSIDAQRQMCESFIAAKAAEAGLPFPTGSTITATAAYPPNEVSIAKRCR